MTDNRQKKRILIYGAYGFTGRLTTALAAAQAMDVILAGRNQQKLEVLGKQFSLPVRQIDLSNALQLQQALIDVATVLHMAGPFANTSEPMLNACLKTRTNYVDITGEISVFEALWARKEEIDRSGISVVPGSGFDVVPTDCLANYVAARQRESVSLTLAVRGLQTVSQGTLRTAIGIFADPVLCRRLGIIGPLTNPSTTYFMFEPDQVPEPYVPVTWGDVSTAFQSTGIRNITAFISRSKLLRVGNAMKWLIRAAAHTKLGKYVIRWIVRRLPEGPSALKRKKGGCVMFARVIDSSGAVFTARLSTPDPYDFAASSALYVASALSQSAPKGLKTPSQAFGTEWVLDLPGCSRHDLPPTRSGHRSDRTLTQTEVSS